MKTLVMATELLEENNDQKVMFLVQARLREKATVWWIAEKNQYYDEEKDEILHYEVQEKDLANGSVMRVAALVREGPVWFFEALGESIKGGLSKVATEYGIIVQEMASSGAAET